MYMYVCVHIAHKARGGRADVARGCSSPRRFSRGTSGGSLIKNSVHGTMEWQLFGSRDIPPLARSSDDETSLSLYRRRSRARYLTVRKYKSVSTEADFFPSSDFLFSISLSLTHSFSLHFSRFRYIYIYIYTHRRNRLLARSSRAFREFR